MPNLIWFQLEKDIGEIRLPNHTLSHAKLQERKDQSELD